MADKKPTGVELLMAEAKAELNLEYRKKWLKELKEKLQTLDRAEKLVRNCKNDITDLEMRINEELA